MAKLKDGRVWQQFSSAETWTVETASSKSSKGCISALKAVEGARREMRKKHSEALEGKKQKERERAQEVECNDLRESGIGWGGGLCWLSWDWQSQEKVREDGQYWVKLMNPKRQQWNDKSSERRRGLWVMEGRRCWGWRDERQIKKWWKFPEGSVWTLKENMLQIHFCLRGNDI